MWHPALHDTTFEHAGTWYYATGRVVWERDPQASVADYCYPYSGPGGGWLVEDITVYATDPHTGDLGAPIRQPDPALYAAARDALLPDGDD